MMHFKTQVDACKAHYINGDPLGSIFSFSGQKLVSSFFCRKDVSQCRKFSRGSLRYNIWCPKKPLDKKMVNVYRSLPYEMQWYYLQHNHCQLQAHSYKPPPTYPCLTEHWTINILLDLRSIMLLATMKRQTFRNLSRLLYKPSLALINPAKKHAGWSGDNRGTTLGVRKNFGCSLSRKMRNCFFFNNSFICKGWRVCVTIFWWFCFWKKAWRIAFLCNLQPCDKISWLKASKTPCLAFYKCKNIECWTNYRNKNFELLI